MDISQQNFACLTAKRLSFKSCKKILIRPYPEVFAYPYYIEFPTVELGGTTYLFLHSIKSFQALKYSHKKNDATQLKNFLVLTLPPCFPHCVGGGKKAVISKLRSFSTELCRSYVDCTLVKLIVEGYKIENEA